MAKDVIVSDLQKKIAAISGGLFEQASYSTNVGSNTISIRNGRFWLVEDGARRPAPDPLKLHFVLLQAKAPKGRTFYGGSFDPEANASPDCYSHDSLMPEVDSRTKQNDTCNMCEKSMWGSATSKLSGAGIPACREHRDIVVKVLGADGSWLLRIPATSDKKRGSQTSWQALMIKVGEAMSKEKERNGEATLTPMNCVIEATFDANAVGILEFRPVGYLPDDEVEAVLEAAQNAAGITKMLWGPGGDARMAQWEQRTQAPQFVRPLPPLPMPAVITAKPLGVNTQAVNTLGQKPKIVKPAPKKAEPVVEEEPEEDVNSILRDMGIDPEGDD